MKGFVSSHRFYRPAPKLAFRAVTLVAAVAMPLFSIGSLADVQAKTTITWAVVAGANYEARYNQTVAAFEKVHPDIEVKWIPIVVGVSSDFQQKILTMAAAGEPPDVIRIDVENLPQYVRLGLLDDLGPYLAKDPSYAKSLETSVFPAARAAFNYEGKQWGIPLTVTVSSTYYNADLLDQAGLNPPTDQWTWDDMVAMAKRMTKDRNGDGKPDQFGLQQTTDYVEWLPLMYSYGGEIIDAQHRIVFNSPANVKAFQMYQSWQQKEHISPRDGEGQNVGFDQGNVGFIMMADWVRQVYQHITKFRWDVASIPAGPKDQVAFIGGGAMGVSAASKHKEAAWEFVKFATSDAVQGIMVANRAGIPVVQRIAAEQYVGSRPLPAHQLTILKMLQIARSAPADVRWERMLAIFRKNLPGLLGGDTSATEFVTKTADELSALR
ncbi:MAG: sugar ABC transporter substrate-binding protein [Limnochordaceae bacterium]|nr:sugar ABC transporter substrate-binding protein [Limnochordaceae bacterium]